MATKIIYFGHVKVLKKNPWYSGKLARLVKMGLAKPKKDVYIPADPPPWTGDPSKLSKAQIKQALRLSAVSHKYKGKPIEDRVRAIKSEASGPTGLARPTYRVELPRVRRLITIARAKGIEVPPEIAGAPAYSQMAEEQAPVIMA